MLQTTLCTSLLRFMEPERGTIRIDGLDIRRVKLETLRQRVTLIPQGALPPCLLALTLR